MTRRTKMLHILKSEPDQMQRSLICIVSLGHEVLQTPLYEEDVDYDELVDLIFEYDDVVTWW